MKNLLQKFLIAAVAVTSISACGTSSYIMEDEDDYYYQEQPQQRQVSYNMFYDQLSPYGNWINYPGYGQVWVVNEPGFRPYQTNGRWVYTNMGWTWASNYDWGWAPFHYGRWANDPRHGWFWVPGYDWAPAWVDWRSNNNYYGWAPMAPNNWNRSNRYDPWVFVNNQHFYRSNLSQYFVPQDRNQQILSTTNVIRPQRAGSVYNEGPKRIDVEQATKEQIRPVRVIDAPRAEKNQLSTDEIRIFRPDKKAITGIEDRPERSSVNDNINAGRGQEVYRRPVPNNDNRPLDRSNAPAQRPAIERSYDPIEQRKTQEYRRPTERVVNEQPAQRPVEQRRPIERNIPTQPLSNEAYRQKPSQMERMPAPQVSRPERPVQRVERSQPTPAQLPGGRTKEAHGSIVPVQ